MYKIIIEKKCGKWGILSLKDHFNYIGNKVIKNSRKGDEISEEEVKEHNKKLLPWYKRIFA